MWRNELNSFAAAVAYSLCSELQASAIYFETLSDGIGLYSVFWGGAFALGERRGEETTFACDMLQRRSTTDIRAGLGGRIKRVPTVTGAEGVPSAMHPHLLHLAYRRPWLSSTHLQPCAIASRIPSRARVPTHRRPISQTTQRRSDELPKATRQKVQWVVGLVCGHHRSTGTVGCGKVNCTGGTSDET